MNGKILMKKYVVAILMAGITLAACGKEGTVPSVGGNDGEGAVLSEVVSDMPSAAAEAVAEERAADPEEARAEEEEPGIRRSPTQRRNGRKCPGLKTGFITY